MSRTRQILGMKAVLLLITVLGGRSDATTIYGDDPVFLISSSQSIVVGTLVRNNDQLSLIVGDVLKGNMKKGGGYSVKFSSAPHFFDENRFLDKLTSERVVALGTHDTANRSILLDRGPQSIWPQGSWDRFLSSASVEECVNFVLTIVSLKDLESRKDLLVKELVEDNLRESSRVYAKLHYAENELGRVLDPAGKYIRNQVLTTLFVRLSEGTSQKAIVEKLISITPNVPPSISVPWLLGVAESGVQSSTSAKDAASAHLRTRDMASADQSVDEIKRSFEKHKVKLMKNDSEATLKMFESEYLPIRNSTSTVLKKMLNRTNGDIERLPLAEQKKYWQTKGDAP